MGHLAIFALGPLRIELDGQPVQTSRHKALALLVYLALNRGRQSRASLSAFLWTEYSQEKAYAYLRRTLWEIRNLLGEGWLEADREVVRIHPKASIYLDISEFQSHLKEFQLHKHSTSTICPDCTSHLQTATLLYRGDFLAGFSLRDSVNFDDWHFFQQEALRRDYAEALQKLATQFYQNNLYGEALSFALRWLALDNLNEEAHRLLMKIYVQDRQRHAALRQYQECRDILKTELEIEPEPATVQLHDAISCGNYDLQVDIPTRSVDQVYTSIPADSAASRPSETIFALTKQTTNNLPVPATPFVGRQPERDRIKALLSDPTCWLLTLLGPGGIGKTRLAIEAGRNLLDRFPQGVFFVSLSMVQNEQSITPAMANTIGMVIRPDGPRIQAQLFDFLHEKHLLLILDSFEGLVPWAHFLTELHANAPGIKLLVTSRRKLHQQGEWILEVAGLDYPEFGDEIMAGTHREDLRGYSAIDLFMQTARRVQGSFQPTSADLAAIFQITRRLEGMPLALELAATWIHTLPCLEIEHKIRTGLDILESPLGDIPERQRNMRAVFNHSWELLSSREQVLLRRLAVFRGSFSRQAAQLIAGADMHTLTGLVDHSLVRRTAHGRYDMHDLLRQYCADKLSQQPAEKLEINNLHCSYFTPRLAQWHVALGGVLQGQALSEMEAELENLQASWEWAVNQKDLDALEQGVDGLCMFYFRRARFTEGIEACRGAVDALHNTAFHDDANRHDRLTSRLRTWGAVFSLNLERLEEASQYLQESQSILDAPEVDPQTAVQERIFWLVIRGILSNLRMDGAASLADFERAYQLSQRVQGSNPRFLTFYWRYLMGGGAVTKEVYIFLAEILADVRRIGDPFELGCHLFTLGIGELFHQFCMEKAEPLLEECIQSFRQVSDLSTEVMVIKTLGYLKIAQGRFGESLALKKRELEIVQDSGDRRMLGIVQAEIGEIYTHLGDYLRAEAYLRNAIGLLEGRSEYEVALRHRYLGDVLLVQGKNEGARDAYRFSYQYFQEIHESGWMMTALTGLSRAELTLGERTNARHHARQALQLYKDRQLYTFFAYLTLAEMALLLADQGEIVGALDLYSLVQRQGFLAQSRWFADLFGKPMEIIACQVPEEARLAAQREGHSRNFSETIAWLLEK